MLNSQDTFNLGMYVGKQQYGLVASWEFGTQIHGWRMYIFHTGVITNIVSHAG